MLLQIIDREFFNNKSKDFQKTNVPLSICEQTDELVCLSPEGVVKSFVTKSHSEQHVSDDFFVKGRKGRMIKKQDLKLLMDSLEKKVDPDDFDEYFENIPITGNNEEKFDYMREKYRSAVQMLKSTKGKEVKMALSCLRPLPIKKPDSRECLYIFGPTGAGKSFYAAKYCELWLQMFPDNIIYRFSRVKEDKAFSKFDKQDIKNVVIDERMITQPITPEFLKGSLCIFDDIDTLADTSPEDKAIKSAVLKLREDLLQTGRHQSVYVINTSHLGMNWKGTRSSINEATSVTCFPSSGTTGAITKFLKTYAGLTGEQIHKFINLPSRWVTMYMHAPRYILYESGCYLL